MPSPYNYDLRIRVIAAVEKGMEEREASHLIEGTGGTQKFLPPYSPDLNPIEHYWFPIKQRIRKNLPLYDRDLHRTIDAVLTQSQSS